MSSTTPNLGLTKTTAAETIGQNWAASNDSGGNFDIIDTKMGAVGNQSVQAQLDALNSKLGKMTVQKSESASGTVSFTLTANKYALIFYAGHMTSVYAGGSGDVLYISGDDPTQYGFTLSRNNSAYTLTRGSGSSFYFAMLIIST